MIYKTSPQIIINKNTIPVIYLDTLAMIEFARCEKGICVDAHRKEIEELYLLFIEAKHNKRILCPLGNQLREMGISKGRKDGRDFLYRFTNSEFLLPEQIQRMELDEGYGAFINGQDVISFESSKFFVLEKDSTVPFIIHSAPVIRKEELQKLREIKLHTTDILNTMKATGTIESDYESQLDIELQADLQLFLTTLQSCTDSEESLVRYIDMIGPVYSRIGLVHNMDYREHWNKLNQYALFLSSSHHHKLPFVWIQAVLWAHRMQRTNQICPGDTLDTMWAAAYLPFVDYVVTDNDFCNLLNDSGLADLYNTKVYSMRLLKELLLELKKIL